MRVIIHAKNPWAGRMVARDPDFEPQCRGIAARLQAKNGRGLATEGIREAALRREGYGFVPATSNCWYMPWR